MPTFFERPLTWLLVGVFLALDGLVIAGNIDPTKSFWGAGITYCQLAFIAEWILRSSTHWLARAATFCIAPAGIAWLVGYNDPRDRWDYLLLMSVWILALFLLGMLAVISLRRLSAPDADAKATVHWQVSIMELIGLTLVVAIGSWCVRDISFTKFWQSTEFSLHECLYFLIGVVISALVVDMQRMRWIGLVIALLASLYIASTKGSLLYRFQDFAAAYAMIGATLFIRTFEPAWDEQTAEPIEE